MSSSPQWWVVGTTSTLNASLRTHIRGTTGANDGSGPLHPWGSGEPERRRSGRKLGAVARAELREQRRDVGLHRADRDVELLADGGVRESRGDELEDVRLPCRDAGLGELTVRRRL